MSHQPINDSFVTLQLESNLYELIEQINICEAHIRESVPDYILLTPSGSPNLGSFWGGVLQNLLLTRATLRSQLAPIK
jgi:phage baseplate assembly protein W